MQAISVLNGAVPTKICDGGHRDFLHIFNNSDTTIYVGYDTDGAALLANLTTVVGMPILPNQMFVLDNVGQREIYNKACYAIHGAGVAKEVRVQGV